MVIASVTQPRATVICERLREFRCFIFSWDSNNRPITRNAPRVSNKATKSRDKQCVTTILVNNSSHGDPRLPPSDSETIASSQVNDQRMETQNNRYYDDNMTTLTARGIIVTKEFCEYFCIFSRQEMSCWWWRVTTESYRSHKNIPTPATFLAPATFYSDFIRRPNILNWGPSFQTERRDMAVSKSYRERETGAEGCRGNIHWKPSIWNILLLAVRVFSGAVFHITSRVIFYFLPRVMNTLDVIYRWNV